MKVEIGRGWLVLCAGLTGCGESDSQASRAELAADAGDSGEGPAVDGGRPPDSGSRPDSPEIRTIQLHREDLVFDALDAGPADGELVLLLHGFPTTPYGFRPQLTALAEAGYHAVAPLQRGYSDGARPTEDAEYQVLTLADDVAAMADDLGADHFHLVGHDWGGGIAWAAAFTHADRLLSLTSISTPHPEALRAAMTDPNGEQASLSTYTKLLRADDAVERLLADDAALLKVFYGYPDRARELGTLDDVGFAVGVEDAEAIPQSHVDAYLDVVGAPAALDAGLAYYRENWGGLEDPEGDLSALSITVPTLFVWGAKDPALGRQAAEATEAFVPNAPYRFVELRDAGHWIPELFSEELTEALLAHIAEN